VNVETSQAGNLGLEKNGMIGFFTDDALQQYFMLTNLNHGENISAASAAVTFSISFDSTINSILRLNRTNGLQEIINLTNNKFTWTLPGGTGDLFKYNTGAFVIGAPGWAVDGSGDWNVATYWGAGGVPNAVDATASFGTITTAARTVYTDTAVKVGTLSFNSPHKYQIAGNGSLTIDVSSGVGRINVLQGSHKINLPLTFADNTTVAISGGATLTLGNPTTIKANKTVTKTGNLIIQAPLIIEAGASLVAGAGATVLSGAPSLGSGASIDVQGGSVTIDYQGQTSPAGTIRSQLASGYNGGAWNGGGFHTSSADANIGLGYRDDASDASIEIQRAYYGDANLNGTVDSTDFAALVAAYGITNGGIWSAGDFDYDGKIGTADFNHMAGNFGLTLPPDVSLGAVVPEPAAGVVLLAGAALSARRRVRVRRIDSGYAK